MTKNAKEFSTGAISIPLVLTLGTLLFTATSAKTQDSNPNGRTGFSPDSINLLMSGQVVSGSMDVRWSPGAPDCTGSPLEPLQVHTCNQQTFILRQNLCINSEGNFIYLLIGSTRALLIDAGAEADEEKMPLASTISKLLADQGRSTFPLTIAHTHSHFDHHAADLQFSSFPSTVIVPAQVEGIRSFFGFNKWPEDIVLLDLGNRPVYVIPTPGHYPDHLVFYDQLTGLLFTGDFLLPGRLLVDDLDAYKESARRVIEFLKDRPVTHVLGGHIELDLNGEPYSQGSQYHSNERPLELSMDDLLALPNALENFNGFYSVQTNFILSNPIHNLLLLVVTAVVVLILIVWGLKRFLKRKKNSSLRS